MHKYWNIIKYLVDHGADVNRDLCHGLLRTDTPLTAAVMVGDIGMVKYLVEKGADIHFKYNDAVKFAIERNATDIINYFDSLGADDHQIFDWACRMGNMELARKKLDKHFWTNVNDGCSPVITVAKTGHLDILEYLHKLGLDIHILNDRPLTKAAESGHLHVVQYLVENNANIRADNDSPMLNAIHKNRINVIEYFAENVRYNRNDFNMFLQSVPNNAPYFPDLVRIRKVYKSI